MKKPLRLVVITFNIIHLIGTTLTVFPLMRLPLSNGAVPANAIHPPTNATKIGLSAVANPTNSENDSLGRLLSNQYYSFQDLGERKGWYSAAAKSYNDCRPGYPKDLLDDALKLVTGKRMLEIGSGPGTATISLAERGYDLVCLEPNPEFCALARENTANRVHIENVAFEEAPTEGLDFDAIVAATCMHWIPAEVGFPKAARSLKQGGSLVLLWNMMLTPATEIDFEKIKNAHGTEFYELLLWSDEDTQKEVANSVGKLMMSSGYFENLRTSEMRRLVAYTALQYVGLLSTYSFYMRLTPDQRSDLFQRIRRTIDEDLGGTITLSYLSLYHVATKIHEL
jgi:SAM-dependent methyltransferase